MLNNAGNKIVVWSKVLLFLGIAVSLIAGFWFIWNGAQASAFRYSVYHAGYLYKTGFIGGTRTIIAGVLIIVFGSLCSWLWALLLRAFGDLAINTKAIREKLEATPAEMKAGEPAAEKAETPAKPRARKPARHRPSLWWAQTQAQYGAARASSAC